MKYIVVGCVKLPSYRVLANYSDRIPVNRFKKLQTILSIA